jgi:hypothetical protein
MTQRFNVAPRPWVDSVGAWISFGCALHCAAIPILFAVVTPLGLGFLVHEKFEKIFLTFSVLVAVGSLVLGYRHHRRWSGLLILASGLLIIALGRNLVAEAYEPFFVVAGAIFLAGAHWVNRYLCHRCQDYSH